jgi:hypothetical protein
VALATTPGPNGAVFRGLGDISGTGAVWADFGGTLGKVVDTTGTGVNGAALKEAIRRGQIITVHRGTDGTHPTLVVEKVENPADAGSSLTLDALRDVTAPATTPAGKVLGTTATGAWGPVDAGGGGVGGAGMAVTRSGFWSTSPQGADDQVGGNNWVLGRAYAVPFRFGDPITITAAAINVTAAADSGGTLRMAVFRDNAGAPGAVMEQTTFPADTTGVKTWTFAAPLSFAAGGTFWIAIAVQGTGTPGGTTGQPQRNFSYTGVSAPAFTFGAATTSAGMHYWPLLAGPFTDNPTHSVEVSNTMPIVWVRKQ